MTKQSTLFNETEPTVLAELDLEEAGKLSEAIKAAVEAHCEKIEVAGSIRRRKPEMHDIDFVVVAKSDSDWKAINEVLRRLKAKPNCSGNQLIKSYVPCQNGLFQVDFYRAKTETFGIHLLVRTGSAEHNCWLAGYAISKGMRLKYSEGLIQNGKPIAGEDEKSVFEALALPFPQPTQREIIDNKPAWLPSDE
jgi:DNA polymerase (family 10)